MVTSVDGSHHSLSTASQPESIAVSQSPEISASGPTGDTIVSNAAHQSKGQAPKPHAASRRVLDVFLVDSGWNNSVAEAVRENLPIFDGYLKGQRFFVLSKEQSLEFIQLHPALVGADPILIVLDREAARQSGAKAFGFRLCLGHMRNPDAAISMLKWAIQLTMASNGPEMASIVKETGHRQTIQGTIELLGEGSAHLLEFAPV
jgi:hypothetical protein